MSPPLFSETSPSRVVILGASGFLSQQLAIALTRTRTTVRSIGRAEIDLGEAKAGERLGRELRKDDTLVFAAAVTPDKGRDIATFLLNLRMAEAGVTALKVQPCRHVVYLSSDAVYGWETTLISEHTPPSPPDLYGTMHLARERMLGQCLGPAKIPFTVIRLCAVYGPGDTHDGYGPNRFLRQATSGAAITLFGEGEETRDHLFVDDAVALIRACIDRPESRLLNAVSGRSRSFLAVAEAVHRLVSRGPGPAVTPRTNPITHRAFDATRLLRAFPAHHSTNLEHGLRLTLDRSVPGQFQQP